MRHVAWTEFRRSPMRWWFAILVAGQLAVLLIKQYEWEFAWSETGAAVTASAGFVLPVAAMSAGWAANRWHRSGSISHLHTHGRSPVAPYLVQFSVTLGYVLLSYLVTLVAAWTIAVMASGWGIPWLDYLLMGAVFLTIGTGFGFAVCTFIESRLAVPAVGVVTFAVWVMINDTSPLAMRLLGGYAGEQLAVGPLGWRALLAIGLAVLAVSLGATSDGWRVRRQAVVLPATGLLLSILAVGGMANAGLLQETRSPAGIEPVCTTSKIEICVWPDQAGFLPELTRYAERLEILDEAGLDVPERYTERGLLGHEWSMHTNFRLKSATGQWIRAGELAFHIGLDVAVPDDCVTDAAIGYPEWERDLQLLTAWPTFFVFEGPPPPGNGGGPPFDKQAMAELIALPESEQIAWAVDATALVTAERPCEAD